MVCDFEGEETTLAGDGLGWEAGNLDGKVVDLSFRELKNFEIVSVCHERQFLQASVSLKRECFPMFVRRSFLSIQSGAKKANPVL